jgi:hypothetical protein
MMNYLSFTQIETISRRPILMIVIERAVSAYFSKEAHSKAAGMLGDAMFADEAGNHSRADACQQNWYDRRTIVQRRYLMPLNIGKEMSRVDGMAEGDRQIRRQANSPMLTWHSATKIGRHFFRKNALG